MRRGSVLSRGTDNPRGPIHVTTGSAGPPKGTSCDHFGQQGSPPKGVYAKCIGSLQFSYSRLTAFNATHLAWEQLRNNDSVVVDRWTLHQDQHGPFPWTDPLVASSVAKTDDDVALSARNQSNVSQPAVLFMLSTDLNHSWGLIKTMG